MSSISSYTFTSPDNTHYHAHEHAHIIIVLSQTFYVKHSGKEFYITPKQVGFIPPGVSHQYGCSGKALTLNIPAEMIKSADLIFLTDNCILDVDEKLEPLISLIKQEVAFSPSGNNSIRYLFYYLYDKFVEQHQMPSLRYMNEHYADYLSIAKLAALENYNVSYYTDWFKKKIGLSPSEYLKIARMDKAREILTTTKYRVIDVAMQVGYDNGSSFIRTFKAVTGVTPGQYRRDAAMTKERTDNDKLKNREGNL